MGTAQWPGSIERRELFEVPIRQSFDPLSWVSRYNPPPSASLPGLAVLIAAAVSVPAPVAMPIPPPDIPRRGGDTPKSTPHVGRAAMGCPGTLGNKNPPR